MNAVIRAAHGEENIGSSSHTVKSEDMFVPKGLSFYKSDLFYSYKHFILSCFNCGCHMTVISTYLGMV